MFGDALMLDEDKVTSLSLSGKPVIVTVTLIVPFVQDASFEIQMFEKFKKILIAHAERPSVS
jgi:hypothetical protein